MRLVCNVPNDNFNIQIFSFNERYVVKFEAFGALEQTYKIPVSLFSDVEDLVGFINTNLNSSVFARFIEMKGDLAPLLNK
ncbi:MAG: hypothetical protein ACXITV_12195 [Luteibaculaceae bacterium]